MLSDFCCVCLKLFFPIWTAKKMHFIDSISSKAQLNQFWMKNLFSLYFQSKRSVVMNGLNKEREWRWSQGRFVNWALVTSCQWQLIHWNKAKVHHSRIDFSRIVFFSNLQCHSFHKPIVIADEYQSSYFILSISF